MFRVSSPQRDAKLQPATTRLQSAPASLPPPKSRPEQNRPEEVRSASLIILMPPSSDEETQHTRTPSQFAHLKATEPLTTASVEPSSTHLHQIARPHPYLNGPSAHESQAQKRLKRASISFV
ncbi:hypothetical protein FS749_005970 [Ceratobasidium sp. UAMH 11750]|nr:hypothetical protein FS749_005970 [Ceratobasidium sp. UAMH 11750]